MIIGQEERRREQVRRRRASEAKKRYRDDLRERHLLELDEMRDRIDELISRGRNLSVPKAVNEEEYEGFR